MGLVYADITLINSVDFVNAKRGILSSEKVRQRNVRARVDNGAYMLTIGEELRDKLGLDFDDHVDVELAAGQQTKCELVGPVKIAFKTRTTTCLAIVLPKRQRYCSARFRWKAWTLSLIRANRNWPYRRTVHKLRERLSNEAIAKPSDM